MASRKGVTVSDKADRVEQFANGFVPKVKVLTIRLVSAQMWAEIDPNHPDAVAVRQEIAKIDPEFTRMLNDLVKLTNECKPYMNGKQPPNANPGDLADERRMVAALSEMTAVVKECTKQEERYVALRNRVKETNNEFLIGNHRFFQEEPSIPC